MEEIKGTEALEREILDDASKKAERIVRKAKEEAERLRQTSASALEQKLAEMEGQKLEKLAQIEKETLSKLPLEKTRLKVRFIDGGLKTSVRRFLDSLDDAVLGAWCLSLLKKRSQLFAGRKLRIRYRGVDSGSVREAEALLGSSLAEAGAADSAATADSAAARRGFVIESLDGAMIMTLTEKELEERLLDEYRGELASALFPAVAAAGEGCKAMRAGTIARISGPIVKARGMDGAGLYDVVKVGNAGLIGEIIRLEGETATIQIYEDNTMMRVGEPVECKGKPLSVLLGPGLIGSIYDGIQRPLPALKALSGPMLSPGVEGEALDSKKKWHFLPTLKAGDPIAPGTVFGTIQETSSVLHRLIFDATTLSGRADWVAGEGDYDITQPLVRSADGHEYGAASRWPVRKARGFSSKLIPSEPLVTGLRVIDVLFPVAKGGCAAVPGGFGTGKTMTQHAIAKWCDAQIIVYIGCGERGNEMTDVLTEFPQLIDPRTGRSLMERTILIANTSNMPVAAREVSIYTGITIAEYYRDMGYHVAVMADSTSRWAEDTA